MSDTQSDTETSRRTLIAAVAAAGAAVPLMGATAKAAPAGDDDQRCGNTPPRRRFVIDLGDVDLRSELAEMLGEQIQKTVLMTLARAGERGAKVPQYEGRLPPYWYGFILNQAAFREMPREKEMPGNEMPGKMPGK